MFNYRIITPQRAGLTFTLTVKTMLFIQVILPVFLIASAGYIFERRSEVDIRSLANSALYLFAPSLVFSALVKSTVATDLLGRLLLFMLDLYLADVCAGFLHCPFLQVRQRHNPRFCPDDFDDEHRQLWLAPGLLCLR